MSIEYLVGCPAWNRAWSLDLWFESLRANLETDKTGLVFVVPPADETTRAAIARNADDFAWVEVMRDKGEPFDREDRAEDNEHLTLATARNRLLGLAARTRPRRFISWDSDLLLAPGALTHIESLGDLPVVGVWSWLNRHTPQSMLHVNPETEERRRVLWEHPMQATAMQWAGKEKAEHFHGSEWYQRATGLWRADVVLAFQMMDLSVYTSTHYAPHPDGEDIPFNWQLERRRVPRYMYGEEIAVHLYQHDPDEIAMGYPEIMNLAEHVPLAASRLEPRDPLDEALGFYSEEEPDASPA